MWLEIDNVCQTYGPNRVLKGISIRLAAGRIGCLLGPSGSGKTSLLRCIAGFEPIEQGEIRVAGELLNRPGHRVPPEARNFGMVFQDFALFPHLNVHSNVCFGLHGESRDQQDSIARRLLEMLGLSGLENKYPHQLSAGQQQRVALARALAPRPRLLLMDEPFSSLDAELKERLLLDVREVFSKLGTTALLVTHDQHEAFTLADEIGVLDEGLLQQWSSAYDLYHEPANRFVANFIGRGVLLPGVVKSERSVEIELGLVEGSMTHRYPVGTPVDVLLRPDDIVHDDDSQTTALVAHKSFRGADILYTLELPSGARILSFVPSHHDHALGEPIGIRLEADHVVAFDNA